MSVLCQCLPSAESLPKEFWKDFFNWKKKKGKKCYFLCLLRESPRLVLKGNGCKRSQNMISGISVPCSSLTMVLILRFEC